MSIGRFAPNRSWAKNVSPLIRRSRQWVAHAVVGVMVRAGIAPVEILHMAVGVDVIGRPLVSIVTDPALVGIGPGTPAHQRRFSYPRILHGQKLRRFTVQLTGVALSVLMARIN